jgi:hypothetical protein
LHKAFSFPKPAERLFPILTSALVLHPTASILPTGEKAVAETALCPHSHPTLINNKIKQNTILE